jgi:hypothetical protein
MTATAAAAHTTGRRFPTKERLPETQMNPNDLTPTLSLYSVTSWHSQLHLVPPERSGRRSAAKAHVPVRKDR